MIYGLLDTKNIDDATLCLVDKWPTGTGLDRADASLPSTGESAAAVWPADARCVMSSKLGGMVLADFVSNTLSLLIVHKRVKEIMEKVNRGPTEYLPLSIYNHKKRLASGDYFVANPLGTYDVLDLKASDIKRSGADVVKVKTFVLDPVKMKRAPDLFRPNESPESYFISKRIASELRKLDPPNTNRNYVAAFDLPDVP